MKSNLLLNPASYEIQPASYEIQPFFSNFTAAIRCSKAMAFDFISFKLTSALDILELLSIYF